MVLRRLSLLLALAWMALLFYLSHQPALHTPMLFPGQDKLFHALVYGVLGILLLGSQAPTKGGFNATQVRSSILIASLYGISDEIHQYFVPGRHSDVWDWVADTLGALLAILLMAQLSRMFLAARSTQT